MNKPNGPFKVPEKTDGWEKPKVHPPVHPSKPNPPKTPNYKKI